MKYRIIPFGAEGWKAKSELFDEILAFRSSPPYMYNDVLILVPSARLRRTYDRLFLDLAAQRFGTGALVPPEIATLHQFLQRIYADSRGPALIDETARLVAIEGIVKECMAGGTGAAFGLPTDVLAPSLSAAISGMVEELGKADVDASKLSDAIARSDFGDKRQVQLLLHAYERYEIVLARKMLVDLSGMVRALADRFDPSCLSRYRRIVLDGVHTSDSFTTRVLGRIADRENCTVLFDAPSPEHLRAAGPDHPLRLLREFVETLGPAPEAPAVPLDREAAFLADALFTPGAYSDAAAGAPSSFSRDIRLLSGVNRREEISLIAASIKDALRAGVPADGILAAFPSLDEYGPLVEEIFDDYGIPYNRALGRQLGASPVTTSLVALLQTVLDDFSGPALSRILGSPFLKFGADRSLLPAFDRMMRDQRVVAGRENWLAAARREAQERDGRLGEALSDIVAALRPFAVQETLPLSRWMERLAALISWSGLAERVNLIKGPRNTNLQAFTKLTDATGSLARAGRLFPEYCPTFAEWLFLLKKTLMHVRYQAPPDDENGVQVLGLEESGSHAWKEIYLGGLIDGSFPQRRGQNIFLPERTLETLGVRMLERTRLNAAYHFYRLLLSAPRVTLTWPENQGDRPTAASPFLAELAPLEIAGLLNRGREKTRGLQFSLRPKDARSIPELAKAVGVTGGTPSLDRVLAADIAGTAGIRSAMGRRPLSAPPRIPQPHIRTFSVTELDLYLTCPYAYYVRNVLGIRPLEEPSEDLTPQDRGNRVHGILKRFYETWREPLTGDNRGQARELLRILADEAFRRDADTFRNRREKEFFLSVMTERFLDAETRFWTQGFRPAYLERTIDDYPLVLDDGTEVLLRAKIDRIDVDERGNFIIVDYKTGKYPQPKSGPDQDIFQLPVYAVMAAENLAAGRPHLKTAVGLAYYDLAGKVDGPGRDVVLYDKEAGFDHPAAKPRTSPRSAEEFRALLSSGMHKARTAAAGILRGEFPVQPRSDDPCRYCANGTLCGKDQEA